MGTNYYCETGRSLEVECDCGFVHQMPETLHIGKNSFGWKFTLHVIREKGLECWKDWEPILSRSPRIFNEYDETVTFEEMKEMILHKENRKLSEKEKEQMRLMAMGFGYSLDEKCWLYGGDSGRPQGTDGNYSLMEGEFS